ncbi:MAG: cation:proton antiporter [Myxococcota bacterium]
MTPVTVLLSLVAVVILVGALGETITKRTQIPDVIWLILLGIFLGPVSGVIDTETLKQNDDAIQLFASITLIIVLFEGGSRLKIGELARVAPRAALLSSTGFVVTVLSVAVVSWLAGALLLEGWTFLHGVMLGAIVGGSSSLIVMPSMNLAKLNPKVSNLVGLESALTDALCVVVTLAMITILTASGESTSSPLATLGEQFGIAILVGSVAAWCWMPVMRLLRGSPHAYPVTLSALIVLYVSVEQMGGSAALGILAFSIVVGNAKAIVAKVGFLSNSPVDLGDSVRDVHSNIAFIIKSLFFCFIGLMIGPPWGMVIAGVLLGLLLLAVRIPAVWLATRGAGLTRQEQKVVVVSLPRGMAAGVLATIPNASGVVGTADLPPLVFAAVVTTILVFAIGFPLSSRETAQPQGDEPTPDKPAEEPFAPGPVGGETEPLLEVAQLPEADVAGDGHQGGEPAITPGDGPSEDAEPPVLSGDAVTSLADDGVEPPSEVAPDAGPSTAPLTEEAPSTPGEAAAGDASEREV